MQSVQYIVYYWKLSPLLSLISAGVDPSLQIDNRIQASSQAALPGSKHNKSRVPNTRDERFRSGNHLFTLSVSFKGPVLFLMMLLNCVWTSSLRFAHRSCPSSFGQVQREEDAHALQETLCASSVLGRDMHPTR